MSTAQNELIASMGRAAHGYARERSTFFAEIAGRLVDLAGRPSEGRVLDVATGPGVVLAELAGTRCELVGIDLSHEMLAEARRRLGSRAELLPMDAQTLAFDDESFDAAFCSCALYQLPDPDRAIAEIGRVLRPGATLAVSVFGTPDERWSGKDALYPSAPEAPVGRRFDSASLREALGGFEPLSIEPERLDVTCSDADDWLASAWTHGERRALERMDERTLEAFRDALPAALEPARESDGLLHWRPEVVYAVGRR
jgi:SAM-dependent methyltransferase